MKKTGFVVGIATLVAGMSAAVLAQQPAMGVQAGPVDGTQISLTGCIVKGSGGFVLSDPTKGLTVVSATITPGTTGTMAPPTAAEAKVPEERLIYWLTDEGNKLEPHVGHRVEVTGRIDGDIDAGNIEIEREAGMIELEVSAHGEKVTVKLPDTAAGNATATGTTGTAAVDKPKDLPFKVRKLEVQSVKMLAARCR